MAAAVPVGKPFAGFADFDSCRAEQAARGVDVEGARNICGRLQADYEKGAVSAVHMTLADRVARAKSVARRVGKAEREYERDERGRFGSGGGDGGKSPAPKSPLPTPGDIRRMGKPQEDVDALLARSAAAAAHGPGGTRVSGGSPPPSKPAQEAPAPKSPLLPTPGDIRRMGKPQEDVDALLARSAAAAAHGPGGTRRTGKAEREYERDDHGRFGAGSGAAPPVAPTKPGGGKPAAGPKPAASKPAMHPSDRALVLTAEASKLGADARSMAGHMAAAEAHRAAAGANVAAARAAKDNPDMADVHRQLATEATRRARYHDAQALGVSRKDQLGDLSGLMARAKAIAKGDLASADLASGGLRAPEQGTTRWRPTHKGSFQRMPVVVQAERLSEPRDIETLEGTMHANAGDWLVTGIAGEQYPVAPQIFRRTYRPLDRSAREAWAEKLARVHVSVEGDNGPLRAIRPTNKAEREYERDDRGRFGSGGGGGATSAADKPKSDRPWISPEAQAETRTAREVTDAANKLSAQAEKMPRAEAWPPGVQHGSFDYSPMPQATVDAHRAAGYAHEHAESVYRHRAFNAVDAKNEKLADKYRAGLRFHREAATNHFSILENNAESRAAGMHDKWERAKYEESQRRQVGGRSRKKALAKSDDVPEFTAKAAACPECGGEMHDSGGAWVCEDCGWEGAVSKDWDMGVCQRGKSMDGTDADPEPEGDGTTDRRVKFQGIEIVIDRPKGFVQTGVNEATGEEWSREYKNDYGYIDGTMGGDGDGLDVFLGDDPAAQEAHWVLQVKPDGSFDEYKLMLGFKDRADAKKAYLAHVPRKFFGTIESMDVPMIRALLGIDPAPEVSKAFVAALRFEMARDGAAFAKDLHAWSMRRGLTASSKGAHGVVAKAVSEIARAYEKSHDGLCAKIGRAAVRPMLDAWDTAHTTVTNDADYFATKRSIAETLAAIADVSVTTYGARRTLNMDEVDDVPTEADAFNANASGRADAATAAADVVAAGGSGRQALDGEPVAERARSRTGGALGEPRAKSLRPVEVRKDGELQYVLGIVLEPEVVDGQADIYDAEEIRKTEWLFMSNFRNIGLQHKALINDQAKLVESYIAPVDLTIGTVKIRKGTWLMGLHIVDDELWGKIKRGELTGLSIAGFAEREPV